MHGLLVVRQAKASSRQTAPNREAKTGKDVRAHLEIKKRNKEAKLVRTLMHTQLRTLMHVHVRHLACSVQ